MTVRNERLANPCRVKEEMKPVINPSCKAEFFLPYEISALRGINSDVLSWYIKSLKRMSTPVFGGIWTAGWFLSLHCSSYCLNANTLSSFERCLVIWLDSESQNTPSQPPLAIWSRCWFPDTCASVITGVQGLRWNPLPVLWGCRDGRPRGRPRRLTFLFSTTVHSTRQSISGSVLFLPSFQRTRIYPRRYQHLLICSRF